MKQIHHDEYMNRLKPLKLDFKCYTMTLCYVFANNTIVSCYFFFLIIDLHLLIPAICAQIFNPATELAMPTGIPTNEAKAEMEIHLVSKLK